MRKPLDHELRCERARVSLEGLATGDAFGERFFGRPDLAEALIQQRSVPGPKPWRYTDDTVMAIAVVEVLEDFGVIDQPALAFRLAEKYAQDPERGYGAMAHAILRELGVGLPWKLVSAGAFGGTGSMGNGSAMRVGPVGAYFADDLADTVTQARLSAQVTHAHPEGQAGAIAVAVAAAWAWRRLPPEDLFPLVLQHMPAGETRQGIERAARLPLDFDVRTAVAALGNGSRVVCPDTVPFALWCAARHRDSYEEALWTTVSGLGDRDTTCAIVGSILALTGASIPSAWLEARESLETMSHKARPSVPP